MKRCTVAFAVLVMAFAVSTSAQQKPATAADKAAAEAAAQKAAVENMAKMAAQQAEAVARAQQKVAEEAQRRALEAARADVEKMNAVVPLDLEVIISRYQGDKKTSSLPYALTVNAKYTSNVDDAPMTSLRMGGEVPLPTMSLSLDGKPLQGIPTGGPVLYKAVGTNIDARGRILDGGRFEIWVSVQDDAIATPQSVGAGAATNGLPVIRSFRTSNNVVLRDGQARQFTAAADRITGEVVKVDVSLKVAK
jgi:chemotaxis protein histidine kinase CheA